MTMLGTTGLPRWRGTSNEASAAATGFHEGQNRPEAEDAKRRYRWGFRSPSSPVWGVARCSPIRPASQRYLLNPLPINGNIANLANFIIAQTTCCDPIRRYRAMI